MFIESKTLARSPALVWVISLRTLGMRDAEICSASWGVRAEDDNWTCDSDAPCSRPLLHSEAVEFMLRERVGSKPSSSCQMPLVFIEEKKV